MSYDNNNKFYLSDKDKATLISTVYNNPYIPIKIYRKQAEMILNNEKEVLYAGGGGGGKSTALLINSLQYVHDDENENHNLILRRHLKDFKKAGSILTKAISWLKRPDLKNTKYEVKYNGTDAVFTFKNGNTLSFGYLATDIDLEIYQGSEYTFIGFEEASHFSKHQYIYMRSRARKGKDNPLPIRIRLAANPGNQGNDWLRKRFIEKKDELVKDYNEIKVVESNYKDNEYINQDDYSEMLQGLDRVRRQQLESGDFFIKLSGNLFGPNDYKIITWKEYYELAYINQLIEKKVRYWDLAATEVQDGDTTIDPDFTAGLLLATDIEGKKYIENVEEFRKESKDLMDEVVRIAIDDYRNFREVVQVIELDRATGKNFGKLLHETLKKHGIKSELSDNAMKNKVDLARVVSSQIEKDPIMIAGIHDENNISEWCKEFTGKLIAYPNKKVHDDSPIAFFGAYLYEEQEKRDGIDWSILED